MNNFEIKSDTKILTLSCKFLIFQTKKQPLITQDNWNKFIELKFSVGCMVWL